MFGKAGRAATATDPAPVEMFETIINLKPEDQWRPGVTVDTLTADMDKALQFPGISNAWTMPIKARIDMLSTGIRTPIGVKVYGPDLAGIDRLSREIEAALRRVPGTGSAFAERVQNGYYLEITPDRPALARYGLTVGDLRETIATALGGETVTTTVEGRERYTVNVRYLRGLRNDRQAIRDCPSLAGWRHSDRARRRMCGRRRSRWRRRSQWGRRRRNTATRRGTWPPCFWCCSPNASPPSRSVARSRRRCGG